MRAGNAQPDRAGLTTPVTDDDSTVIPPIHQALKATGYLPSEHLMDTGYTSRELLTVSQERYGVTIIQTTAVVNIDETSWREAGRRGWLWTSATAQATSFRITTSRGRPGLDALLPASFGGIVGSDRWNASNRYAASQRQLCSAHLTRNFRALAEGGIRESPWATDAWDELPRDASALPEWLVSGSARQAAVACLCRRLYLPA